MARSNGCAARRQQALKKADEYGHELRPVPADPAGATATPSTPVPLRARACARQPGPCSVGYLAGIHQTDWSWERLAGHLHGNDGFRDLFVSNGIRRTFTDTDFIIIAAIRKS